MMDYRMAAPADAALLGAMNKQLIEDEGHRNPMTVGQLQERMAGWLGGDYEAVLFGVADEVRGYALYRRESDHVYLRHFFVGRAWRRGGIGRTAMAWLLANAWKGARVRVEVLTSNEAGILFWRAVGFQDYSLTMERG